MIHDAPRYTPEPSFVVARSRDGATLHVTSGALPAAEPRDWFWEVRSADADLTVRAEWSRDADFTAPGGAAISLDIGGLKTTGVLQGDELTLDPSRAAAVDERLGALGAELLRLRPEDWPFRPSPQSFDTTDETFGEFISCVADVTTVAGGLGAAAGLVTAGPKGAGAGAAVGAGLGAAGGSIGCGIGW